ncbi:MAG: sugar phosphate isomerase/epimerase [Vicinamibacterales bacterium]
MLSRRAMCATPLALLAARVGGAQSGKMTLAIHMNTSAGAGYRRAMEGWAKAGITNVELNAAPVDEFIKTDTLDGARRVLTDNGLTPVSCAVGVPGLIEPNPDQAAALDNLKRRLEMLATLGLKKIYTTTTGTPKLAVDDYKTVADNMRRFGETARQFNMMAMVEFVRSSSYMATLPTALKTIREAAHPNLGPMFDFYHFWSGNNKLEDLDLIRPGEIQHVHFQDVPDLPRELLDNNSRFIPGDGVSPLNLMLKKLAEKGYAGPLSVELFLPKFRDGDPFDVATEIRRKAEAVMRQAGVM